MAPLRVLNLGLDRPDPDALGGVAVHVAALATSAPRHVAPFTAYPAAGELVVESWSPRKILAAIPIDDDAAGALTAAVAGLGARVLHVHAPAFGPAAIARAARATGARVALSLHDHALVCENYELLEGGERYCGIPVDVARCDRCLATTRGRPPGSLAAWRDGMSVLVQSADAIVAPSRSVLEHAARVHPSVSDRAHRIAWGVPEPRARRAHPATDAGSLRVAVVGVWAKVKGAARLPALLGACRELDVEFHLFGATEGASLAAARNCGARVVAHGAYPRGALAQRLVRARCHAVALPSVGAETFSLVLSEVVAAGFPVLASNLGALGERVTESELGWSFDPEDERGFAELVSRLVRHREEVERVARHASELPLRDEADMAADHAALWTSLASRPGDGPAAPEEARKLALARFESGVERAAARRPSRLDALFAFLKKTDFYRDLRLRTLLSEETRKAIETALRRPSYGRRSKERR